MLQLLGMITPGGASYPQAHLLIVEMVRCDVFLESEEKRWYEESILKEASMASGLVTGHFCEALFSLVNAGTI